MEINKFHKNEAHLNEVSNMFTVLIDNYLTRNINWANGVLFDDMYSRRKGSNPESVILGITSSLKRS